MYVSIWKKARGTHHYIIQQLGVFVYFLFCGKTISANNQKIIAYFFNLVCLNTNPKGVTLSVVLLFTFLRS